MYTVFYRVNCLFMVFRDRIRVRFGKKISYNFVRDLFERFQIEKNPKFNSIRTPLSQSDRFFFNNDLSKCPRLFIWSLEPSTTEVQGKPILCCSCKTYRFENVLWNLWPSRALAPSKMLISLSCRLIRSHLGSFTVILPSGQKWPCNGQFILYF